jgi:CheY-like chemotaxis protein
MARGPEKKALIIVEDNAAVAEVIKDTLNGEPGYRAVVVHDGAQALEVIHSIQVDAVLLDVALPGLSGPQIYEALKADKATRHLPVIFITAHYDSPEFKRLGITNFIAKPFNLDDLLAQVEEVCGPLLPVEPVPAPPDDSMLLDASLHDDGDILYFLTVPQPGL